MGTTLGTKFFITLVLAFITLSSTFQEVALFGTDEEGSSRMDADLFLEDEGSGYPIPNTKECVLEDDEDCIRIKETPTSHKPEVTKKPVTEDPSYKNEIFESKVDPTATFFSQPGILAAIICGAIVGLLCAILLVMFIVYRMRKKDEGSYVLEDSKRSSSYGKAKEFYA